MLFLLIQHKQFITYSVANIPFKVETTTNTDGGPGTVCFSRVGSGSGFFLTVGTGTQYTIPLYAYVKVSVEIPYGGFGSSLKILIQSSYKVHLILGANILLFCISSFNVRKQHPQWFQRLDIRDEKLAELVNR